MATLLLIVIYITFIGLGLPDSLLGAAWPVMHQALSVPLDMAGFASVVTTGGTVISSLVSERLIRRFGTARITAASVAMTAAALVCVSVSGRFHALLLCCVPLGLGAGTVDAALNNFVALHYKSTHMNWLHCFWGVGATAGPLIMSFYLARGAWRVAYRTVSPTLAGIALLLVVSLPLWRRFGGAAGDGAAAAPTKKRALLRLPGAVSACLAFVAYCGMEYAAGLWASTYFVQVRGLGADVAASWASAYFLGITGGRLAAGFLAMKLSDRTLVRLGLGLAALGLCVLLLPLPGAFPLAGLLLLGLGSAPVFPCLLDQTPALFGAGYSQGMMGLQMAGAYIGGSLMGPLFGWLSPAIGVGAWPCYLLALLCVLAAATEYTQRAARRSGGPSGK